MKTTFEVRDESYEANIEPMERPEGEKFELYQVAVRGPDGRSVNGTFKLTDDAVALANEMAADQGGSAESWVAKGGARSLASEILIRKLEPDFAFVVDHRWIGA